MKKLEISGHLFFIQNEAYICFTNPKTDKAITRKVISRDKDLKTCICRLNNDLVTINFYR